MGGGKEGEASKQLFSKKPRLKEGEEGGGRCEQGGWKKDEALLRRTKCGVEAVRDNKTIFLSLSCGTRAIAPLFLANAHLRTSSSPFIFSHSPLHRLLIPSYCHRALPFAPALDPFPPLPPRPIENKVDTLEIVSFSRPEATLPSLPPSSPNPFSTTVPASSAFSPLSCAPFSPITLSLTFILVARPRPFLPSRLRPLQREKRGSPGLWGNRFHPLRPFPPQVCPVCTRTIAPPYTGDGIFGG